MSKKENEAIQAAIAARLAKEKPVAPAPAEETSEEPAAPDLAAAPPAYSAESTKAQLQEVAVVYGLAFPSTMSKAEMLALLDEHTKANPAQGEGEATAPDDPAQGEGDAPAPAVQAFEGGPRPGLVTYNGYVNLRSAPTTSPDSIAGRAHRGERLTLTGEVEGDGHKWFMTMAGQYIMADAGLVKLQ